MQLDETRMQLSIGPYMVLGRLHSQRGLDPMQAVLQREPMIPLTSATIAYTLAGTIVARDVGTVIVNRLLVDWISADRRRGDDVPGHPDPVAVHDEPPQGLHGLRAVILIGSRERQSGALCAPVRRCAPRWRVRVSEKRASSTPAGAPAIRRHQVAPDHRAVLERLARSRRRRSRRCRAPGGGRG